MGAGIVGSSLSEIDEAKVRKYVDWVRKRNAEENPHATTKEDQDLRTLTKGNPKTSIRDGSKI